MAEENKKLKAVKDKLNVVFEKVGELTKIQRLVICIVTFAIIGGGYYYFIFTPKNDELTVLKKKYQTQSDKLQLYKKRAAQLIKYEKIMAQKKEEFTQAMGALPDKRELPALLTDISRAGSDAGLTFHLFKPDKEIIRDFYKEIPISIKVEGRYHQITDFFWQIIRLNRIVNINKVEVKSKKGRDELQMSCKAVTYMFVEKKDTGKKKKRKRKKK